MANESAILMCGQDVITWRDFRNAIFCLRHNTKKRECLGSKVLSFHYRIEPIFQLSNDGEIMSFGRLIHQTKDCKATDPRDRVYALLSILEESERELNIEPDYRKTKAEVYQDVVFCFMENLRSTSILSFREMHEDSGLKMPSWVPDWSRNNLADPLGFEVAAGSSLADGSYLDQGVLAVTGVLSASIEQIKKVVFVNSSNGQLVSTVLKHTPPNILDAPYVAGGSLLEAYCRTLCCNNFGDGYMPIIQHYPQFEPSQHALQDFLNSPTEPRPNSQMAELLSSTLTGCGILAQAVPFSLQAMAPLDLRPARQGQAIRSVLFLDAVRHCAFVP